MFCRWIQPIDLYFDYVILTTVPIYLYTRINVAELIAVKRFLTAYLYIYIYYIVIIGIVRRVWIVIDNNNHHN